MAHTAWEKLLKVDGWESSYESVDKLLRHLGRKTRSEASRATYLKTVAQFVRAEKRGSPDDLITLPKKEIEEKVQAFCDRAKAPRTANRKMEELKAFFKANGFRTGSKSNLIVEKRYVGARQRSKPKYIPTDEEIRKILDESGLNLKWRAFLLTSYTTGLRNSTMRALKFYKIARDKFPKSEYKLTAEGAISRIKQKTRKDTKPQVLDPETTLLVVACSKKKVWQEEPNAPTYVPARLVYKGSCFKESLRLR